MSEGNGRVGLCACGEVAINPCRRCGRLVCDTHANAMPTAPAGISPDALSRFEIAARASGSYCESCRADLGSLALARAIDSPRAPLPEHWLDRAIALESDATRSELEKVEDAGLPPALTAGEIAAEFLRRIGTAPRERVPVTPTKLMTKPRYVEGWSVDCRRTEYAFAAERFRLPCLISTDGALLGPGLEDGARRSETWLPVPDADIELPRLVIAVAQLLLLSELAPPADA